MAVRSRADMKRRGGCRSSTPSHLSSRRTVYATAVSHARAVCALLEERPDACAGFVQLVDPAGARVDEHRAVFQLSTDDVGTHFDLPQSNALSGRGRAASSLMTPRRAGRSSRGTLSRRSPSLVFARPSALGLERASRTTWPGRPVGHRNEHACSRALAEGAHGPNPHVPLATVAPRTRGASRGTRWNGCERPNARFASVRARRRPRTQSSFETSPSMR